MKKNKYLNDLAEDPRLCPVAVILLVISIILLCIVALK